jgi:pimeloyl-ACP methyl ester carboxylesterase
LELVAELERTWLAAAFRAAVVALLAAPELDESAETATPDLLEHRKAIARALVAYSLTAVEVDVDGETRDALVERITNELHGYGRGISNWLARPFKGLASRTVTRMVGRRRGSVTDAAAPAAGDILRYQARGAGIRAAIRQAISDTRADRVTILAHSLGGIACVDLLVMTDIPEVDRLVTVGSQAPFLYEIGALVSLEPPEKLPARFPDWLNIYDPRDFLGYVGEGVFPGRVTDVLVDNGQPFPQSHSAYWGNRAVWAAVGDFLA